MSRTFAYRPQDDSIGRVHGRTLSLKGTGASRGQENPVRPHGVVVGQQAPRRGNLACATRNHRGGGTQGFEGARARWFGGPCSEGKAR